MSEAVIMVAMLLILPGVIHVVTSTDWAAVIAAMASGVAAIATFGAAVLGIRGTAREAERSRKASSVDLQLALRGEQQRQVLDRKRSAYAELQTSLNGLIVAATTLENYAAGSDKVRRAQLTDSLARAFERAQSALSIVRLTDMSGRVHDKSQQALGIIQAYTESVEYGAPVTGSANDFLTLRNDLYDAMIEDINAEA